MSHNRRYRHSYGNHSSLYEQLGGPNNYTGRIRVAGSGASWRGVAVDRAGPKWRDEPRPRRGNHPGQLFSKNKPNFQIVERFERETNAYPIVPVRRLKGIPSKALESVLADLVGGTPGRSLSQYLQIGKMAPRN